tara:strand:+ start:6295 stop:8472 length:2178 start_codon:yes stop_codon:yes gene_type:complete
VADGDFIAMTDAMEKMASMQESESKAASDYDAVDSIGKNVTNSSLYGVNKKEKVKANLTSPEKSRLKNKMSIFVKEWFTLKGKYEKDTKPQTVVAGAKSKAGKAQALLSKEEGEKEGGGLLDWISGLLGMLGIGGFAGRRGLIRMLGGWIWKGVKWAGGKIWGALKGVGQAGWNAIKAGFQGVGRFFSGLWQGFKGSGFWKGFTGAISNGVSAAGNMLSSAKNALQSALSTIGNATRSALSTVTGGKIPKPSGGGGGGKAPKAPKKPRGGLLGLWDKGKEKLSKGYSAAKDFGGRALQKGGQMLKAGKDAVVGTATKLYEGGKKGVQFAGEKVRAGKDYLMKKVIEPAKALIRAGFAKVVGKGGANISKFLSTTAKKIPIIGPAIEALFTGLAIRKLKKRHEEDPEGYNAKQLNADAGTEVIKGIAGAVGTAGGAFLGGLAGAVSGPLAFLGVPIASLVGSLAGNLVAKFAAGIVSKYIIPDSAKTFIGKTFTRVDHEQPPEKQAMGQIDMSYDPVDDFIWRPGYKPQPFSRSDIVMGMKRGGPIGEMVAKSQSVVNKVVSNTTQTVSKLFGRTESKVDKSNALLPRLYSGTGKILKTLFGKTQDTVKRLTGRSKREIPESLSRDMKAEITSADSGDQSRSTKIAELQLKAIGVSNTYLSQLVQLTQALVKKPTGGAGGGSVVSVSQPNNSIPPTQGDPSGPAMGDSRVEFYNSAYSMHTPGTLA